ncbi:MAG: hypothetical protein LAO78_25185 [Acidobacteriia bacterium]|nr:hypothetical protein [Terriglobia bacterium]
MTKDEITAAILAFAEKLGKTPTRRQLMQETAVTRSDLTRHFGSYERAVNACNLKRNTGGKKVTMGEIFRDWAKVVRKLQKIPTMAEYELFGEYSLRPLKGRFGSWFNVPEEMKMFAEKQGMEKEWQDVLDIVRQQARPNKDRPGLSAPPSAPRILADRPMYGLLVQGCPLVFAPVNEAGVVYLFGALSERLGFLVLRIQTEFPDCEAMRLVGEDRMQLVKIEFEHESRNFLKHAHDPSGCDLIVCWEHNWPECPVDVLELKGAVIGQQLTAGECKFFAAQKSAGNEV